MEIGVDEEQVRDVVPIDTQPQDEALLFNIFLVNMCHDDSRFISYKINMSCSELFLSSCSSMITLEQTGQNKRDMLLVVCD